MRESRCDMDVEYLKKLEKMPTPFFVVRVDEGEYTPLMLSEEASDFIGYSLETLKDMYLRDPSALIYKDDVDKVRKAVRFTETHPGTAFDVKMRMIKASSIVVKVRYWGKTVREEDGSLVRYSFIKEQTDPADYFNDASNTYSVALYDMLMASSNIGIVQISITDIFKIVWCNEAAHKLIGYNKYDYEREFGSDIVRFFKGNELELIKINQAIRRAREKKLPRFDIVIKLLTGKGEQWLQGTATFTERSDDGQWGNTAYYAFTEITESVKHSKKLAEARLAADRANESKSAFLSCMSHDIRTPLNGIAGFTELAIREPDPEVKQEYLTKIRYAVNLLTDLVNDTLDLSRIESGKMTLNKERVNSRELGETIIMAMKPSAELKGITLISNRDSFREEILIIDRLKIQKIFINLISNAIKYTPEGGTVSISVTPLGSAVNGCLRRIVIEDTGIGISEEFMPRLFDPFAQEMRPEVQKSVGTGLGLAIVKRMIELMDGSIEVESTVGKGTKITVDLPVETVAEEQAVESGRELSRAMLKDKMILVAEDNTINMDIATIMLNEAGIKYDCAEDGSEAVDKFYLSAPGFYDAVLMDIRMPVLDGYEATRRIRGMERADAKDVPIIAMTADAFEESVSRAYEYGMNDYITKPMSTEKLINALSRNIHGKK
jgi:signal transduction histidine kinase/ActR/RegA family two-component response regulator